jgi:hypothetical protein
VWERGRGGGRTGREVGSVGRECGSVGREVGRVGRVCGSAGRVVGSVGTACGRAGRGCGSAGQACATSILSVGTVGTRAEPLRRAGGEGADSGDGGTGRPCGRARCRGRRRARARAYGESHHEDGGARGLGELPSARRRTISSPVRSMIATARGGKLFSAATASAVCARPVGVGERQTWDARHAAKLAHGADGCSQPHVRGVVVDARAPRLRDRVFRRRAGERQAAEAERFDHACDEARWQ